MALDVKWMNEVAERFWPRPPKEGLMEYEFWTVGHMPLLGERHTSEAAALAAAKRVATEAPGEVFLVLHCKSYVRVRGVEEVMLGKR